MSVELKGSAQQTHDNSVATTYNTYSSQQFDVSTQTGFSDVVWFTHKRFTIYAYRVLGRCSPATEGCPPRTTRPLYVQFSGPDMVTQGRIDGNQLEWYQPVQEPGNVLSYPWSAGLLQDLYGGFTPLTADPATVVGHRQLGQHGQRELEPGLGEQRDQRLGLDAVLRCLHDGLGQRGGLRIWRRGLGGL